MAVVARMVARSRRLAVVADRRERPLRVAEGDAVSHRLQTTREHALTLLRAAWPNVEVSEESTDTGTRIKITLGDTTIMSVNGRTVNKAWAVAMSRARKLVERQVPVVDLRIACAEIEVERLRAQRRRIIDTLNGFETDEVTP